MTQIDELRLIARVATMYYEMNMRQSKIAKQLGLSQATISRLLKRAQAEGIIRITVNIPQGVHSHLEESIIKKYNIRDVIVVESDSYDNERTIQRDIGVSAAYYLENFLRNNEIIGISSWSTSLLAMVDALHPISRISGTQVIQILGGVGNPSAQVHASHLTKRLADLVNGTAVFLPAPGVVGSQEAMNILLEEEYVKSTMALFDKVTTALVGIGSVEPSHLLAASGNIFNEIELKQLQKHGAVGDILLHFFDKDGKPIEDILKSRVISMNLQQLRNVERAVGVAGGYRKYQAILGALKGKLINILITDVFTAKQLIQE